jgi:5-formaminoimidazole-4-carboxamide-1-(beta)-D-ribofuranosyl 5'-monophosphate synthetase
MGHPVADWLADYDPAKITIATAASHSSLQIFHAARKEGFRTLALSAGDRDLRYYDAFPLAKPDEFLKLKSYHDLQQHAAALRKKNTIIIPHGSLIEYLGANRFAEVEVPVYGNRDVLEWESNRDKERTWLEAAGIKMPRAITDPKDIVEPVIVKYHGAKGGKGFFIAKNYHEFRRHIREGEPYNIQEFVLGTRYYLHYFHSRIDDSGYRLSQGNLQMLSIDRRDESNIDEANRLGSIKDLEEIGIEPTFVVTGNIPMVIRESLLPEAFRMGAQVIEESYTRFGGLWGPFCLETVVTPNLEFRVFEISARIVAGTNPFIGGSPYTEMIAPGLSTGRRIAQDIKAAAAAGKLAHVLT